MTFIQSKVTTDKKCITNKHKRFDKIKHLPLLMFVSLCLSTPNIHAQKVVSNEIDKFTGAKKITTNYVLLGGSTQAKLATSNDKVYLILNGVGGGVVGTDDKLIFLLADGNKAVAYSVDIQTATYSGSMTTFAFQYKISQEDLSLLQSKQVTAVRKYLTDGYTDIEVKPKNAQKFQKLCQLLM